MSQVSIVVSRHCFETRYLKIGHTYEECYHRHLLLFLNAVMDGDELQFVFYRTVRHVVTTVATTQRGNYPGNKKPSKNLN